MSDYMDGAMLNATSRRRAHASRPRKTVPRNLSPLKVNIAVRRRLSLPTRTRSVRGSAPLKSAPGH